MENLSMLFFPAACKENKQKKEEERDKIMVAYLIGWTYGCKWILIDGAGFWLMELELPPFHSKWDSNWGAVNRLRAVNGATFYNWE